MTMLDPVALRVFPRKTSMTPRDDMIFIGDPPLFRPDADEVHISVTFTWDIEEGYRLRDAWCNYYSDVRIGGPAISGSNGVFIPGQYLRHGVTITSRGCDRKCPWCLVPEQEGNIKLLDVKPGYIVQDNNLLATPREHQEKVYAMLRKQKKAAVLSGGLDARLVDDWVTDQFCNMRIKSIFLAADTKGSLNSLARAVDKLAFLGREKLRCYVMIGYNGETQEEATERLQAVWDIGCLPFAQLYQPPDEFINYPYEWKSLARTWSRPAAMRSLQNVGLVR